MRRSGVLAFCLPVFDLLMAGCATVVPTPPQPAPAADVALAAWARVLQRFVNDRGEVDFTALNADAADPCASRRMPGPSPTAAGRDDR